MRDAHASIRQRLSEPGHESDQVVIPLFHAFMWLTYLDATDRAPAARAELSCVVNDAWIARMTGRLIESAARTLPLMVAVSQGTWEVISMIPYAEVITDMETRFTDAIKGGDLG